MEETRFLIYIRLSLSLSLSLLWPGRCVRLGRRRYARCACVRRLLYAAPHAAPGCCWPRRDAVPHKVDAAARLRLQSHRRLRDGARNERKAVLRGVRHAI